MAYNHNQYGSNGGYYDEDRGPRRGGGVFAAIVIIVVVLLLAALVVGLLNANARRALLPQVTPVPSATAEPTQSAPPIPATPTPLVPDDPTVPAETPKPDTPPVTTDMPDIDGLRPELGIMLDNPIPDIYEAVSPSVVGVVNYRRTKTGARSGLEIFGSGSGFIVSSSGYVLTNAHVVDGADELTVLLADGTEIEAALVGADNETDVGVLRIAYDALTPIACGDSDAVRVGEFVLAIGNPLDTSELANTVTYGIISAKEREITIDGYTNVYLQTDAAINFGNSGGPLLNLAGEVIGMNSAKTITAGYDVYGNAVSAEGIGFALPINDVLGIMERLVTEGAIRRPAMGVEVTTVTEAMSQQEGVPVGARVESVVRGGPSALAGVRKGDIIVEAEGSQIKGNPDLILLIQSAKIGDTFNVRVYRAGEYLDIAIVLGEKEQLDFDDSEE